MRFCILPKGSRDSAYFLKITTTATHMLLLRPTGAALLRSSRALMRQPAARLSSSAPGKSPSEGGRSPLGRVALGLAAVFGGGYAVGYVFGPLPSLEELLKPLTGGSSTRAKYDGEVRSLC